MIIRSLVVRLGSLGRRLRSALARRPARVGDAERENESRVAEARAATELATRASREAGRAAAKAGRSLRRVDRVVLEGAEEIGRLVGGEDGR